MRDWSAPGARRLVSLRSFRNAYLVRSLFVWLAIRLAAGWMGMVSLYPLQAAFVVAVVAAAVLLDARRRDEHLFLGNLGISPLAIVLVSMPVPFVLEVAAAVAVP